MAIDTLIDKVDASELLRDQIAAILVTESASQQALAVAVAKDPAPWKLRVFVERSDPWAEWMDDVPADTSPIVSVRYDNSTFDGAASNVVERQKAIGVFNIDVYGYGVSADSSGGHVPGDMAAAFECQRAMRLVRNMLMAGTYTYLGLRGTVWKRWPQSITCFQPAKDERAMQQVSGARLALEVHFSEFSPQVTGDVLTLLMASVTRASDGLTYVVNSFDYGGQVVYTVVDGSGFRVVDGSGNQVVA